MRNPSTYKLTYYYFSKAAHGFFFPLKPLADTILFVYNCIDVVLSHRMV